MGQQSVHCYHLCSGELRQELGYIVTVISFILQ